jgi:hypothetical protein
MRRSPCGTPVGFVLASVFACLGVFLGGCGGHDNALIYPVDTPGPWILDSVYVLDEFRYSDSACAEVFPPGSATADTLAAGSAAYVRLVTTSCYSLTVRVVDSDSDTVRTFSTRFAIFNRSEGEKNRGVSSFAAWDGKDDQGKPLGAGRYLWHMDFDFGLGRLRRFRADIMVP